MTNDYVILSRATGNYVAACSAARAMAINRQSKSYRATPYSRFLSDRKLPATACYSALVNAGYYERG